MTENERTSQRLSAVFENRIAEFFKTRDFNVVDLRKSKGTPDFLVNDLGYVECTVAEKGKLNDGLPKDTELKSGLRLVPEEEIKTRDNFAASRILQRIDEKRDRYKKYCDLATIDIREPRIVALTIDVHEFSDNFAHDDAWQDVILRLLYTVDGNTQVIIDGKRAGHLNEPAPFYKNNAENKLVPLTAGIFVNREFADISALLFVLPKPKRPEGRNVNEFTTYDALRSEITYESRDLILYRNKNATKPLTDKSLRLLDKQEIKII